MKKQALITGATSGIGRATALRLSAAGYAIIATGRRAERLATLKAEIEAAGGCCTTLLFDVRSEEEVRRHLEPLERVDLLVNNAGLAAGLEHIDPLERFQRPAHLLLRADVECERRAAAARGGDLPGELREAFGAAARRRDVVSLPSQPERRGASDSRGGSRDECLFIHDDSQKTVLSGKNTKLCVTLHKFSDKIPLS